MNCIIVDDEPLGRKAIQLLIQDTPVLSLYCLLYTSPSPRDS